MLIKILYDNSINKPYISGWGFSCYLEDEDVKMIFDTGWNGEILLSNIDSMNIKLDEINKIVISHPHWDHIGGLNHLLEKHRDFDIYIPQSFSENLKNEIKRYKNVIEVNSPQKITKNVWTTGQLGEKIKEQSLLIKTQKGNIILTGCAHPGLDKIIKESEKLGPIYAIIGGFHDMNLEKLNNLETLRNIPIIIPCHCTKNIDSIKREFPIAYRECKIGFEFNF
jgi:7,8-dihydropterin-6-yl-methyl-4-(beta-D-ribofuranosyl)aminobenzene 5'-phosphate synthase